jgi:hypothetical protein
MKTALGIRPLYEPRIENTSSRPTFCFTMATNWGALRKRISCDNRASDQEENGSSLSDLFV